MVRIGCITAAANFYHVKAKLSLDMSGGIVLVGNVITILPAELGIEQRDRFVDRNSMAGAISRIMRKRSQRKRVLIHITGVSDQRFDEVAGSDVVGQVAEISRAERYITQVLYCAAAVRIRTRLHELVGGGSRESLQEKRLD